MSMKHHTAAIANSTATRLQNFRAWSGFGNLTTTTLGPKTKIPSTELPPMDQIPLLTYCSRNDPRCFNKKDFCQSDGSSYGEPVTVMCYRTITFDPKHTPDLLKPFLTSATVKPFTKKAKFHYENSKVTAGTNNKSDKLKTNTKFPNGRRKNQVGSGTESYESSHTESVQMHQHKQKKKTQEDVNGSKKPYRIHEIKAEPVEHAVDDEPHLSKQTSDKLEYTDGSDVENKEIDDETKSHKIFRRSDGSDDEKLLITTVDVTSVKLIEPAIELTKTGDDQRLACDLDQMNFTYNIPVSSETPPDNPITLQFKLKNVGRVLLCRFSPSEECPDLSNQPQDDVSTDHGMITEHNFPLAFSNYIVADYMFRVTDSHGTLESVCDDDASNAGTNFIEYNLHFYRTPAMPESSNSSPANLEQVDDYSDNDQYQYDDNGVYDDSDNGTTVIENQQWR